MSFRNPEPLSPEEFVVPVAIILSGLFLTVVLRLAFESSIPSLLAFFLSVCATGVYAYLRLYKREPEEEIKPIYDTSGWSSVRPHGEQPPRKNRRVA